jgi:hypothetical protein
MSFYLEVPLTVDGPLKFSVDHHKKQDDEARECTACPDQRARGR